MCEAGVKSKGKNLSSRLFGGWFCKSKDCGPSRFGSVAPRCNERGVWKGRHVGLVIVLGRGYLYTFRASVRAKEKMKARREAVVQVEHDMVYGVLQ